MASPHLFIDDPFILFRNGNATKVSFVDRNASANTVVRLTIYGSIIFALLLDNPWYAVFGALIVLLVATACKFTRFRGDTPLNESYKPGRVTKLDQVHDLALGQTVEQQDKDMQSMLLSNVREQNYYLGEDYGTPNGIEYMLGGTRPGAPNRTDALRNNPFFNNPGRGTTYYEPPITARQF